MDVWGRSMRVQISASIFKLFRYIRFDKEFKKGRAYLLLLVRKKQGQQFICAELILFLVKRGKPTDEELEQLGIDIAEGWRKLGRRLKLDESTLQEIDNDYDQQSEKGYHMLMRWKQNTGANATYQALRDALQHKLVHRQDLVEKFCYFKGLYNILLFPAVLSILDSGQRSLGWSQRLGSFCFVLNGSLI